MLELTAKSVGSGVSLVSEEVLLEVDIYDSCETQDIFFAKSSQWPTERILFLVGAEALTYTFKVNKVLQNCPANIQIQIKCNGQDCDEDSKILEVTPVGDESDGQFEVKIAVTDLEFVG